MPTKRGSATRVEYRSPDPSCNPYLALTVLLKAGLEGIKNKIEPPAPINRNIYDMTKEDRDRECVPSLPSSLYNALKELKNDDLIRSALGERFCEKYIQAKLIEWDEYRLQVTDWELEKYLNKF